MSRLVSGSSATILTSVALCVGALYSGGIPAFGQGYSLSARAELPAPMENNPLNVHVSDGTVRLKKEDWASFDGAIRAVAAQGKIAVVAEGIPLTPAEATQDTPLETMPLEEAIAQIARRFDYDVLPHKSPAPIVCLQKRYARPIDIPCVPPEEWILALRDMADIVRPFEPNPPVLSNQDFVEGFARSLTPEQWVKLKANALPVAALTEAQKGEIQRLLSMSYSDDRTAFETASLILRRADQTDVGFEKFDGLLTLNFGQIGQSDRSLFAGGIPFKSQDDGSDIDLNAFTKGDADLSRWKLTYSLQSALTRIAPAPKADALWVVDAALQHKILSIAGEGNAAAPDLLRAVAAVYGLRVITEDVGGGKTRLRLTRRKRVLPSDRNGVPKALLTALPDPIRRYLQMDMTPEERAGRDVPGYLQRRNTRIQTALRAAVAALRQSIEARTDEKIKPERAARRYPLRTLGVGERSAFALANTENVLRQFVSAFGDNLPPVDIHWQEATLQGGPYARDGKSYFSLRIYYETENPDGSKDGNGGGMGDVPYEPESER